MKLSGDILLFVCLAYVVLLFAIAFFADRAASQGRVRWLRSPVVFTLSISVYCTAWTFYGAVGAASRKGLEFITIYLGPTLVFIGWFWLLRKLVRIGRAHKVTSIADLLSSRYGKSPAIAVLVTLMAVVATTPYIALQLESVTKSYHVVAGAGNSTVTALWVALGLALFAILFGTRNLDANERHHGVVAAIAAEAVVKLVALLAVGIFVVWGMGGFGEILSDVPSEVIYGGTEIFGPRWAALTFLSAAAIICLPRQFQVTVVENVDERHLATASWMFPLYLLLMCIFIVPIAIAGQKTLPDGASPDLFVLTLPLYHGREELALFAFLGGFSSATSMVIVAAIAVSTMVSNHMVMPLALRLMSPGQEVSGDLRALLLTARRVSIVAVLGLGLLYFTLSEGGDLAKIGLIAFAGVAQFLPSLVGGIFWRGATRKGAITGLVAGGALWAYTLFLPSFSSGLFFSPEMLAAGPWGIAALRPEALLGLDGLDNLVHALIWSIGLNTLLFLVVSVLTEPKPLERLQGAQFVDIYHTGGGTPAPFSPGVANAEDLFILAQRILGSESARLLFDEIASAQGRATGLPLPTPAMISRLERVLAGSVGASSAHAMVGRIAGRTPIGVTELIDIADETQRLIVTTRQLAEKSAELEGAARQLRDANERLRALDAQKDEFLSQVSHELRTPMTSIRSFSEILLDADVGDEDRARFARIVNDESQRLTRLLDEILDISHLETGTAAMELSPVDAGAAVSAAIASSSGLTRARGVKVVAAGIEPGRLVRANEDRLQQVLMNLLTNAVKYNPGAAPEISVVLRARDDGIEIDVADTGGGVSREEAATVFEKFARGARSGQSQGAGLGLPISRAIMRNMGGDLTVEFREDGTSFFRAHLVAADRKADPAVAGG